jgi:hypothetical protein
MPVAWLIIARSVQIAASIQIVAPAPPGRSKRDHLEREDACFLPRSRSDRPQKISALLCDALIKAEHGTPSTTDSIAPSASMKSRAARLKS